MKKKRVKSYSEEFRKQAVSLADQPGKLPSKLPHPWVFIPIRFITGGPSSVNYQKSNSRF